MPSEVQPKQTCPVDMTTLSDILVDPCEHKDALVSICTWIGRGNEWIGQALRVTVDGEVVIDAECKNMFNDKRTSMAVLRNAITPAGVCVLKLRDVLGDDQWSNLICELIPEWTHVHVTRCRQTLDKRVMWFSRRNDQYHTLKFELISVNNALLDIKERNDRKTLMDDGVVWIDEWVRRSNGDRYEIVPDLMEPEDMMQYCTALANHGFIADLSFNIHNFRD